MANIPRLFHRSIYAVHGRNCAIGRETLLQSGDTGLPLPFTSQKPLRMRKLVLIFLSALTLSFSASAQKLSGVVKDELGKGLDKNHYFPPESKGFICC